MSINTIRRDYEKFFNTREVKTDSTPPKYVNKSIVNELRELAYSHLSRQDAGKFANLLYHLEVSMNTALIEGDKELLKKYYKAKEEVLSKEEAIDEEVRKAWKKVKIMQGYGGMFKEGSLPELQSGKTNNYFNAISLSEDWMNYIDKHIDRDRYTEW
ncbi:MAG: hypothetical protein WBA57_21960 [Elainellaceae cyanobacterium]